MNMKNYETIYQLAQDYSFFRFNLVEICKSETNLNIFEYFLACYSYIFCLKDCEKISYSTFISLRKDLKHVYGLIVRRNVKEELNQNA